MGKKAAIVVEVAASSGALALAVGAALRARGHALQRCAFAGAFAMAAEALRRLLSRSVLGLTREPYPIEEWAALYDEEAFDPEVSILDPHHHLWHFGTQERFPPMRPVVRWLLYKLKPRIFNELFAADFAVANSFGFRLPFVCPYMGEELLRDLYGPNGKGHKVVGTVFVECGWHSLGVEPCMAPVGEADMVAGVHRQHPGICNAIVAHADLRLGKGVEPALRHYSKNALVKGIRHSLAWSNDRTLMGGPCDKDTAYDPKFREGFALLSKYGFSYDCWVFHEQVDALVDLARAFPNTMVICDHIGMPLGLGKYVAKETLGTWKASMATLAKEPNVVVKIGGLGMRFVGFGFDERRAPATSDELAEAWAPYVRFCIDTFGVDRCMMESNFPMDKVTCTYTVLMNALKKIVKDRPVEERKKLFELNARRVYRL